MKALYSKIKALFRKKEGMTMVNVLIAFVILLMMVSMFTGVALFTQNAVRRADAEKEALAQMMHDFYTGSIEGTLQAGTDEAGNSKTPLTLTLTDGKETIDFPTAVFSYEKDGLSLYTYGAYATAGEAGDGE